MLPLFGGGTERRRQINLGGASSSTTHSSILDQAKVRREERLEHRRRTDNAVRLQAWWRGVREKRRVVDEIKKDFDEDLKNGTVTDVQCLRRVAIIGSEDVLGRWSAAVVQAGVGRLFDLDSSPSWLVLIKQIATLLMAQVAKDPQSSYSRSHLEILNALLSGSTDSAIIHYLLAHQFYALLSRAVCRIPIESKNTPNLPLLVSLATAPFARLKLGSEDYTLAIHLLFIHVITIPLLPNRLPLATLTHFSSNLPLSKLDALYPVPSPPSSPLPAFLTRSSTTAQLEAKIHLVSNLLAFTPPRYAKLPGPALVAYLRFISEVMDGIQPGGLEGPTNASASSAAKAAPTLSGSAYESDDEGDGIRVTVVSSFAQSGPALPPLPILDAKTQKRLLTLPSTTHLASLLTAVKSTKGRYFLVRFLYALVGVWPSKKDAVLSLLWTWNGGGFVREAWRGWVRGSGLGRDLSSIGAKAAPISGDAMVVDDVAAIASKAATPEVGRSHLEPLIPVLPSALGRKSSDEVEEDPWAPLLLLTEAYTQALVTMGDDEFFSSSSDSSSSSAAHRNPLSLDEISTFTRKLLNIAWVLWMHGTELDSSSVAAGFPRPRTQHDWLNIREKVTRCLVAINARDARRAFMPKGGWLVLGDDDERRGSGTGGGGMQLSTEMAGFVEAAMFEAQQAEEREEEVEEEASRRMEVDVGAAQTRTTRAAWARPRAGAASRTMTNRQLSYLTPRLGVLNNIPFAIPFHVRVAIFRSFVYMDAVNRRNGGGRRGGGSSNPSSSRPINPFTNLAATMNEFRSSGGSRGFGRRNRVTVRRGNVAQDGFDHLGDADLKDPVEIVFIDQWGEEEAGIDGGGVFKEFFTSLCKEVFDTNRGLWLTNEKNELYPNPLGYATEAHSLNWYRFIGRILGKAMYEGILVDVAFAGFFLAKWLGKQSFLDDLASLDPDLYNGLIFLKHYAGNPEDLTLNFTVTYEEFGTTRTVDLVKNGSNIAVTKENRLQYIYLVSHFKLSKQIRLQSEAFFEGLSDMIDPQWLRMFNQQEVQILLGGVNAPVDLDDLRANTNYGGLYDDNEPTIVAFWNVVNTFDQEQRRALLRFVTSCSRPPLLGFKELIPNFAIRDAGSDQYRLPTSSTCVNLLKLPRYTDERVLRSKLLQAIMSNAGFDLS